MINRVVLVGRITRDPELRKTNTGTSVVSFTLAVNRRFTKDEEQKADFINCQAWRQSADFMANYVKQGALLGVEGRIQTRNYKDQSDRTVYVTEVVCDSVQILAQKRAEEAPNTYGQVNYNQEDYSNVESEFGGDTLNIQDDDLPF
nr:MAG TPA: Single strand binding protein [Caudoviricetes sp.]